MAFEFSCPVCGNTLKKENNSMKCADGHCFDIAKQGYVNLLRSQSSSAKRHGDDKLMVKARFDFLDKGYYSALAELLCERLGEVVEPEMRLLDLGCGECWYTAQIVSRFAQALVGGIDISKQALIMGAKRTRNISLAVASIFDIPVLDGYCDVVTSVFAPYSLEEIARVLKSGGFWVRAYPLENHLMGLKRAVYDTPYANEVDRSVPQGFELFERDELHEKIELKSNADIQNLFAMTPYYYKTSRADQQKLDKIEQLTTEIEFGVDIFKKL